MVEKNPTPYDQHNVFAKILRGELPSSKVYEDADTIVIMDIMPRGKGHCLVIPKRPARNILDADDVILAAVAKTTGIMARAVKKAFNADGVTVQQYNETAGGQVVFHLHVHVIARFEGERMQPSGTMGDMIEIAANAEKIKAALAD